MNGQISYPFCPGYLRYALATGFQESQRSAFLTQQTLQTPSPPYHEIPRKLIVSKRLAQCLNPALPSGVHQRALDVYSYIFSIIGVSVINPHLQALDANSNID